MALSLHTKGRRERELFRAPSALGDAAVSRDASKLAIMARQADGKTALQVIELATAAVSTIATLKSRVRHRYFLISWDGALSSAARRLFSAAFASSRRVTFC
jgi:hypothetical protein